MDIDNRGTKRFCTSCSTKFYDLNKSEVICPKCNFKLERNNEEELEKKMSKKIHEKEETEEIENDINVNDIDFEENEGDNDNGHIIDIK